MKTVTVTEAQEMLNVSKGRIHQLRKTGQLVVVKEEPFPGGKRYHISRRSVEKILKNRTLEAAAGRTAAVEDHE